MTTDAPALLTLDEVSGVTRLSKPTIYRMVRRGKFPQQLQIGMHRVAWLHNEVVDWIGERASARAA